MAETQMKMGRALQAQGTAGAKALRWQSTDVVKEYRKTQRIFLKTSRYATLKISYLEKHRFTLESFLNILFPEKPEVSLFTRSTVAVSTLYQPPSCTP